MNRRNKLKSATAEELVQYFVAIAVVQDKAVRRGEIAKYNRLYGEMDAVGQELKQRPGDQRRALIPLYEHPNAQVRLKAAIATLALLRTRLDIRFRSSAIVKDTLRQRMRAA